MTTQRRALDEIVQTLDRKLALDDHRWVGFHNEIHMAVRLRPLKLGLGEIAHRRKYQVISNRLDFNAVRNCIQVAHNLLEIRRGQIDDGGILNVGDNQLLRIGVNEPQLVVISLPYILVIKFHPQIRDNAVLVILLVDIHREGVVVRKRRNQLEKVHGVGAYHNLVGDALIQLELVIVKNHTDQHRMGFIKIDDFHRILGEGDGRVRQYIL